VPGPRRQYRLLQAAFIFALIGVAFFAAYAGYRASDYRSYEHTNLHGQQIDKLSALWRWFTHDATGVFTLALCIVTGILAWFTYALYKTTVAILDEERRAATEVRSILRGAGDNATDQRTYANVFWIQASNSGEGAAVINRIEWSFVAFGDWAVRPYQYSEPSGEVIASRERAKPVKIVPVPIGINDPVIVFRFEYYDVNQKSDYVIDHAMRLWPPHLRSHPVFIDVPAGLLVDTFPIKTSKT
jgi:hypothetical protein